MLFGGGEGPGGEWLQLRRVRVPLRVVRNGRAKRYLLRLGRDGCARVTVPRGGNRHAARVFAERNVDWVEVQFEKWVRNAGGLVRWELGTEVWFRGERMALRAGEWPGTVGLGDAVVKVRSAEGDLRGEVTRHLRVMAGRELRCRVAELGRVHGFVVRRVSVRDQRSRWGSCSTRGTISLNWRLIQVPEAVRDYIILHELAHLREMNHSERYWAEVARLCPGYEGFERWLKEHGGLLAR